MRELKLISQEELNEVLKLHKLWLDTDGGEGKQANLRDTDLSNTDLRYADLRGASLRGASLKYADLRYVNLTDAILTDTNLSNANLSNANLRGAILRYANLRYTNLSRAILTGTDLRDSNLIGANLSNSDLICANLSGADLTDTDSRYADLRGANLSNTDLRYANLRGANLTGTNLSDIKYNHLTSFFTLQCPEEGSFIGYKKSGGKIVELLIMEDSLRSSATSRKCRASHVKVLSITSLDGKEQFDMCENTGRYKQKYVKGEEIFIEDFDKNRWNECSTGIHFFMTRDEAVNYN